MKVLSSFSERAAEEIVFMLRMLRASQQNGKQRKTGQKCRQTAHKHTTTHCSESHRAIYESRHEMLDGLQSQTVL